jgi:DedD protein
MRTVVEHEEETDSEITLNTPTLLGIFFGLVLVCGVFFGFGYSIGRRGTEAAATPPAAATSTQDESPEPTATRTPKPSAMESLQAADTNTSSDTSTVTEATDAAPTSKPAAQPTPIAPVAMAATPKPTATSKPVLKQASLPIAPAAPVTGNSAIMVQVAAVTHQEDANVLVSALRRHGYSVSVRNEPQDKLLHVQVGPFTTRDTAKIMRAKLQADGYNAILKP